VNCNPCLEDGMALARSAKAAGISYTELLEMIIAAALEKPPFDADVPMLVPPRPRGALQPLATAMELSGKAHSAG